MKNQLASDIPKPENPMTSRKSIFAPVLAGLALAGSASAATLLSTNFQGHATGAVTDASLNAVTTGGTWVLNTARGGNFVIEEDAAGASIGDKALLLDDDSSLAINTLFTTLTLTSAASFATNAITFTTSTMPRRTGPNRDLRYQFRGTGGTIAGSILWDSDTNTVSFNGGTPVALPFVGMFGGWDADNADIRDMTAVFSGGTVTYTFGGVSSGPIAVQNSVTDLLDFRTINTASGAGAVGLYLDEILITQVPEPRAALLGGLGLLVLLRRLR